MDDFEQEEQYLEDQLSSGEIGMAEYNKEIQKLQREYRSCANESAQSAYDEEMGRW